MTRNVEKKNKANLAYYYRNRERLKEAQKLRSKADYLDPVKAERRREAQRKHRRDNPEKTLYNRSKYSSIKRGLEFNIDIEDIFIPKYCPLLNIELSIEGDKNNSPSLDRIDNSKGYIKGNIWVISNRANCIKRDASIDELDLITKNLRRHKEILCKLKQ